MPWIDDNYSNIVKWASNITKSDELTMDLAHYSIEQFMLHPRYNEVMQKHEEEPHKGHPRGFILAIMRNSWLGPKSEFSRVYKLHRADIGHRKRVIDDQDFEARINATQHHYDYSRDFVIEACEGILEEMEIDTRDLWFKGRLFKLWLETPNFSKLSRETGIPRTSISNAVEEAKQYIKQQLKERGIDYEF